MSGTAILDVALGLGFVYLLLSLMCTAMCELIAAVVGLRQKTLFGAVKVMLGGSEALRAAVYKHPLVKGVSHGWFSWTQRPSYLPAELLAAAVQNVVASTAPV